MDIKQAVTSVLTKYAKFDGRAMRSEYWWFVLANIIAQIVLSGIDYAVFGQQLLSALLSLALLIPGIAVSFRRMHDIGKSAWNLLWLLIPIVGFILIIYWFAQPGTSGDNQYGPEPTV
jgi:uncharacterized membrane protein YhaH (DUF805 family)